MREGVMKGSPIKAGVNEKKVVRPRFFFGFAGRQKVSKRCQSIVT